MTSTVRFLGIEAFRLFDEGKIQLAMEYSNISFGRIEEREGRLKITSFKQNLRPTWAEKAAIYEKVETNGYDWHEVSVADSGTGALFFFRSLSK